MKPQRVRPVSRRCLLLGLGGVLMAGCTGARAPFEPLPVDTPGQPVVFDAPGLAIRGRFRPAENGRPARHLWVVIEGDGAVWRQGRPPSDPTPTRPVGPEILEALPRHDDRLWLARPCQYLDRKTLSACAQRFWTQDRFAPPVLAAYQTLIDRYASGRAVRLIGFSGGGVLAAELALSRADATGLITLAAPLDLDSWTTHHAVPPLTGPRPSVMLLRDLAQLKSPALYLFGDRDRVVPPIMLTRTRAILQKDRVQMVPGMRHSGAWASALAARLDAAFPPG